MTVYNINLGIGWASSGVEYAQAYRAKVLRDLDIPAKFIFTDLITNENIEHFTKNIGLEDEEVIWLYQYFTDIKTAPTTFTTEQLEATFDTNDFKKEKEGKRIRYTFSNDTFYSAYLVDEDSNYVHRVEYVSRGFLIRKDFFTYTRTFTEYYAPKDKRAQIYARTFYNEDGSIAYDEHIRGNDSIFVIGNDIYYSKEEFFGHMIDTLPKRKKDVLIVDRTTGIGAAILKNKGRAQVGVVIHAEHFSENSTNDENILWNNYYEYTFTNTDYIDFFIASTQAQSDMLMGQFKKYSNKKVKVVTIPVGSLDQLRYNDNRKPHSLITASRLAGEKHVDQIVEAVAIARKEVPDVSLDIYGKGGEEQKIRQTIEKNNAQDYVHMMGHQKLDEVFCQYEGYISASGSEGFGLTLLEAVGSGLPMIGFDVRYGNPTFIYPEENGVLIEGYAQKTEQEKVEALAQAIVHMFKDVDLDAWINASYSIAEGFTHEHIEQAWENLVGGSR